MNYRELKNMYEAMGARECCAKLQEAFEEKLIRPKDFSLRDIGRAILGDEIVESWRPNRKASHEGLLITEAVDAVTSAAFSNITGQLIVNRVKEAYNSPAFVFSRLIPSTGTSLSGEKIPGVTGLGDAGEAVVEGKDYPRVGFAEDFVETPATTKRGLICEVTKETVYFDRTGQVLTQAGKVGEALGIGKEKRLTDVAIGKVNNYKWKGTTYNTYDTGTNWDNVIASNQLVDWTDIDAVEQKFAAMSDPWTGEPIVLSATQIVVPPSAKMSARRVLSASELRYGDGASNTTQQVFDNPVTGYSLDVSVWMYRRLISEAIASSAANAQNYWFVGDFANAFAYMENWPITVVQAPQNNEAEFARDVVARYKASERGVAAVIEPRKVVKCYQTQ